MQIYCTVSSRFESKFIQMEDYNSIILISIAILTLLNALLLLIKKDTTLDQEVVSLIQDQHSSKLVLDTLIRSEFKSSRDELARSNKNAQQFTSIQLTNFEQSLHGQLGAVQKLMLNVSEGNSNAFHHLQESIKTSLTDIRDEVQRQLLRMQNDNHKQLEKMRHTVDEKLHKTLENRLGKSFELVSKQLAEVQKGLGEMQHLANGVGDLKKVLTNVKTRGVMGEIQLGNILDQLLTAEQYGVNVATIPGSRCHVEFAVKLPGRDADNTVVWLPIDSKFPMDRYVQLQDAYDSGDKGDILKAKKTMYDTIRLMAKDIRDKYISPPHTTDFGILFLPTEGLYADVVRNSDLCQKLQQEYKIMLAGPTNLAALLNSLQMGFRSLAIEKRSSEVWKILGAVKTEFGKFGGVLEKVQKKLSEASNTLDKAGVRTRAIERNLRDVESLPEGNSGMRALPFDDGVDMDDFAGNMEQEPSIKSTNIYS